MRTVVCFVWVLQGPAVKEKLAAILILLRAPLLLGLSMDAGVFMSGVGWALVAVVSFALPACPDELSGATSGLSFTGITNNKKNILDNNPQICPDAIFLFNCQKIFQNISF